MPLTYLPAFKSNCVPVELTACFVSVALTAPGFGAATTTAAAPATGFSFGSTNTGTIHLLCKHVTYM